MRRAEITFRQTNHEPGYLIEEFINGILTHASWFEQDEQPYIKRRFSPKRSVPWTAIREGKRWIYFPDYPLESYLE